MAADKKGAKPSEADEAAAAAIPSAEEAKKKRKKILLFVGFGFLLVIISVGATVGAIKLLSPKAALGTAAADKVDEHSTSTENSAAAETDTPAEPSLPIIYFALKPNFTVNYDVNGRQRFLQAELTVMYRNTAVLKVLELHMPAVRNGLVLLLSNQSFDDLQTVEGKEKLRAAALKIVQDILTKEQLDTVEEKPKEKNNLPNIEQILFTNFVMQ